MGDKDIKKFCDATGKKLLKRDGKVYAKPVNEKKKSVNKKAKKE